MLHAPANRHLHKKTDNLDFYMTNLLNSDFLSAKPPASCGEKIFTASWFGIDDFNMRIDLRCMSYKFGM